MIVEMSHEDMLERWMIVKGLEPLRGDCTIERSDGIDLEAYAAMEMRRWYLRLLSEAPPDLVNTVEMSHKLDVKIGRNRKPVVELPPEVVRPVSVMLTGWKKRAEIVADPCSPLWKMQSNPFLCGGTENPVALLLPGRILELYSVAGAAVMPVLAELRCVVDPGPELYILDESLLP